MAMFEAKLSSAQTYSGTSFATVTGLTLTPGAGTYLAIFMGTIDSSISNGYHYIGLAVDGSDDAETEREHLNEGSIADPNVDVQQTTHKILTVGAGEAIQARWRASATGTMTMRSGVLTLIEVSSTSEVAATDDDTTITSTPSQIDDMLIADPAAADYLAVFSSSIRASTSGVTAHIAIYVGGTIVSHTQRSYFFESSLTNTTSWQVVTMAKVSPNGSQDIQVFAWTSSGTGTLHERALSLIGGKTVLEVNGTASDTESTSGTDKAIDDLTHINPAGGDYLAFGSFNGAFGTIGANSGMKPSLYEETTYVPNTRQNHIWGDSLDAMVQCVGAVGKVSPTGSEDVSLQWQGDTTNQREATHRTFILLQDAAATEREQENFRFRDDDGDEDEAAWLAAEETNITRAKETTTRLRILTDTATADPPSEVLQLEYKRVADAATEWRKVPLT